MVYQSKLFDSDDSHFSNPYDGETLYSWCARHHRLSNNINAKLTSKQLFGHSSVGFRHDFPTRLFSFSENTHQFHGSIEKLIYSRTVLPIFSPFLSQPAIDDVIQNMRCGIYSRIAYRLGLRATSISTVAPLKACTSCMHEDKRSFGTDWWHIEHQFPTVRICPTHGNYLFMATQEFHSRGLSNWYFPADIPKSGWHDAPVLDARVLTRLRKLNEVTLWLAKYHDHPFDPDILRLTYFLRAKSMGWVSIDGGLKFAVLVEKFRSIYACLESLPGFSFIRDTAHDHGGFLGAILLNIGINKHPLRNLLLIDFLFNDPNSFLAEYELACSKSIRRNNAELWPEFIDSANLLNSLITDAGYTVNVAARQLHIPIKNAIRSLKQNGIKFEQDQAFDEATENALTQYLVMGVSLDEIVSKTNIKKRLIISYLTKHSDVQNTWRIAVKRKETEKYRSQFFQYLSNNPSMPLKDIQRSPESRFRWLKIHDPDWLKENLPGLWNQ